MRVQKSYGDRVKNAFAGVIIGAILFLGSFVLLAWNERDAVRQTSAINEIEEVAVEDVSVDSVNAQYEGVLVHMKGRAKTEEELENRQFGIRLPAIRLRWDASIYQVEEDKREDDDEIVYSYKERWVDRVINSNTFHDPSYRDANEGSQKTLTDGREQASDIRLGAFHLSDSLIGQISNEHPLPLEDAPAEPPLAESPEGETTRPEGTVSGGIFYTGDPSSPQVGDEKIEFFIVDPEQDVTVMAQQKGESFAAFQTKVGVPKELLYHGLLTKAEVIGKQRTEAAIKRWLLRLGGFVAMWVGMMLAFKPIKALLSFLPFVDDMVGFVVGAVTFVLALAMTLMTIAVFWFASRPILAISLVAVAAALIGFFMMRGGKRQAAPAAAPLPTPDVLD